MEEDWKCLERCGGGDWREERCGGSDWREERCGGSDWREVRCGGSDWREVRCGGSDWREERCGGSDWREERCGGSDWREERCGGSDWREQRLRGSLCCCCGILCWLIASEDRVYKVSLMVGLSVWRFYCLGFYLNINISEWDQPHIKACCTLDPIWQWLSFVCLLSDGFCGHKFNVNTYDKVPLGLQVLNWKLQDFMVIDDNMKRKKSYGG